MICDTCGIEMEVFDRVCSNCGSEVEYTPRMMQPAIPHSSLVGASVEEKIQTMLLKSVREKRENYELRKST